MKLILAIIRYRHGDRILGPHMVRIAIKAKDGRRDLYWGSSGISGYGIAVEDIIEICHEYGRFEAPLNARHPLTRYDPPFEMAEAADSDFDLRYPPQPDWRYKASEGLISPDGLFYPCAYGEHTFLIHRLARLYYDYDGNYLAEDVMVKEHGWLITRNSPGMPMNWFDTCTSQQARTIRLLVEKNSKWAEWVQENRWIMKHIQPEAINGR